jgi:hypothetical protein
MSGWVIFPLSQTPLVGHFWISIIKARSVPLTEELIEMFKDMREALPMPQVKVL